MKNNKGWLSFFDGGDLKQVRVKPEKKKPCFKITVRGNKDYHYYRFPSQGSGVSVNRFSDHGKKWIFFTHPDSVTIVDYLERDPENLGVGYPNKSIKKYILECVNGSKGTLVKEKKNKWFTYGN